MDIDHWDAAPDGAEPVPDMRRLSAEQLQQLGVSRLAYVKPVPFNGGTAFAIHGADGGAMALAGDLELVIAAIRRHEMVPALVH